MAASRVGTRFGKYEIIGLLGRGGMGEVYEARDTEKSRIVALKVLVDQFSRDPEYRNRFTREAHAAAQLQEPHVIPIHDWGEIDGSLYIDMRLVRGTDLRRLLKSGPLQPDQAINIIGQIAGALDAAHADGLIHRDVKPENIIVTSSDFAYLVDFGIAEKSGDTRLTQAGMTVGSLAYMAPERLDNKPTEAAADVYSLACVLFEALTGDSPFSTESMQQLLTAHLYTPPPRPSELNPRVPTSLDGVIQRGMAKEPDDRYGSAGAFARAAGRALSGAPCTSQPIPVSDPYATMAAPGTLVPINQQHTWAAVPSRPSQSPQILQHAAPQPLSAPERNKWVIPAAVGAAAALILGLGGIAIGMMVGQDSSGSSSNSTAAQPSLTRLPPPNRPAGTPSRSNSPTRPVALPPVVRGADANHQACENGITHPRASGQFSRAGRGTVETTCLFAQNVLNAYWEAGPASPAPRTVYALGAVPCPSTGGRCAGDHFVMECAKYGADDWVTCTGGKNARVYLY
ncbi:serine/threonine-protein kinase [Mycobacterium sp. URHB0044]|uniref:serine/threonine-protein kinase n=1 Tax=Mycobacterium sp. URHB0044 TaxID=1380386 RepID=UPI00048FFD52|nr:serine/threonine-protein kinase [Mycobacterium sp. URHB0044]